MIGYVGAAASKSIALGLIILATSALFVPIHILHPFAMVGLLVLTAATFSLFGFIVGIWANGWEQIQIFPTLVLTPLTFLGGAFYSIGILPPPWRTVTLFNPVVYLISAFRWSFYQVGRVGRNEPRHDARVHARRRRGHCVDIQDRLQAQKLITVHIPPPQAWDTLRPGRRRAE